MKQRFLPLLAAASLLANAAAATRPHYGGTLRIEHHETVRSLDPADLAQTALGTQVARLLYETLVRTGDDGLARPALAESWSAADDAKTWSFTLRQGARFSDGSPLTAPQASASLHVSGCAATAAGNTVRVACELPHPHLAAEVAEVQNSVVVHAADGSWLGSGPFIARVPSGSALSLRANDNAWRGRPFVDAIEITTARALRDQALDYDLGRADVIEISPEQARRATQNGARIAISPPVELIALALQSSAATGDERVRQALSAAIDRDAIHSVLLQRQGQPAAGLLPGWISGYDFLFPVSADMAKARDLAAAAPSQKFTVSYDAADSLAKLVAERVALNARDAGVALQTYGEIAGRASNADIRVLRLRIDSADPVTALAELAARIDPGELPRIATANSAADLYAAERAVLEGAHLVPLVYVPEALAIAPRVHDWSAPRTGGWPAADVWLEGKP